MILVDLQSEKFGAPQLQMGQWVVVVSLSSRDGDLGMGELGGGDVRGGGGDEDADHGEGVAAVRAAVLPGWGGDCVAGRGRDDDIGDDVRDDVTVAGVVAVSLGPGRFAARVGAVAPA